MAVMILGPCVVEGQRWKTMQNSTSSSEKNKNPCSTDPRRAPKNENTAPTNQTKNAMQSIDKVISASALTSTSKWAMAWIAGARGCHFNWDLVYCLLQGFAGGERSGHPTASSLISLRRFRHSLHREVRVLWIIWSAGRQRQYFNLLEIILCTSQQCSKICNHSTIDKTTSLNKHLYFKDPDPIVNFSGTRLKLKFRVTRVLRARLQEVGRNGAEAQTEVSCFRVA